MKISTREIILIGFAIISASCKSQNPDAKQSSTTISAKVAKIASLCPDLLPFKNTEQNALPALRACVARTPISGVLALEPGKYTLSGQMVFSRPITLTTTGQAGSIPCNESEIHSCAELRASTDALPYSGMLQLTVPGITLDHIVINGRKEIRTLARAKCAAHQPGFGYNIQVAASNTTIVDSVTKNAVCGTSLEVWLKKDGLNFSRNTIANNGVHDQPWLWADGLTVHDSSDSIFIDNIIHDNTDVDMIFGGCSNCKISGNKIGHTGAYKTSSFAAFMMYHWNHSTGVFTGTVISDNTVDCAGQGCGYGFYIGTKSWGAPATIAGGTLRNNRVENAPHGFMIGSDANGTTVGDNFAATNVGNMRCNSAKGLRQYCAYSFEPGTNATFSGTDVTQNFYKAIDYGLGATPNFFPGCTATAITGCSGSSTPIPKAEPIGTAFPVNSGLKSGESLTVTGVGQSCKFDWIMQGDGNLVLYRGTLPIWNSASAGNSGARAIFQSDGNLVVYRSNGAPAWHAAMNGRGGLKLFLQGDGNVVMFNATNNAIWSTGTATAGCNNSVAAVPTTTVLPTSPPSIAPTLAPVTPPALPQETAPPLLTNQTSIPAGTTMTAGNELSTTGVGINCTFKAALQGDGNFVLSRGSTPIWSTTTNGIPGANLIMQNDGNLVIYRRNATPAWSSVTAGKGGNKLTLLGSGRLEISTRVGDVVWASTAPVLGCINK